MGSPYKPLVVAIQEQAKWFPSDTYMRYAPADWETKGYRSIIWRQYLDGINKIAHWLDAHLGGPSSTYDTVAYSGPNDVRYAFLWPAMIKTGRKVRVIIIAHSGVVVSVSPEGHILLRGARSVC